MQQYIVSADQLASTAYGKKNKYHTIRNIKVSQSITLFHIMCMLMSMLMSMSPTNMSPHLMNRISCHLTWLIHSMNSSYHIVFIT